MASIYDPRVIAALQAAARAGVLNGTGGLPPQDDDGSGGSPAPFPLAIGALASAPLLDGGSSGSDPQAAGGGGAPFDAQGFSDLRRDIYQKLVNDQGVAPGQAMVMAQDAARQSLMGGKDGADADQGDDGSDNSPGPFPQVGGGLASAPLLGGGGPGAGAQGAGGGAPLDAQGFSDLRRNIYQSLVNDQGFTPGQAMVMAHEAAQQALLGGQGGRMVQPGDDGSAGPSSNPVPDGGADGVESWLQSIAGTPAGPSFASTPLDAQGEFQAAAGATGMPITASGALANPSLDGGTFGYAGADPSAPNDGSGADDGSLPGNFDLRSLANSAGMGADPSSTNGAFAAALGAGPAPGGDIPTNDASGAATDFANAGQPVPGASTAFAAGWSPPGRGQVASDVSPTPFAPRRTPATAGRSNAQQIDFHARLSGSRPLGLLSEIGESRSSGGVAAASSGRLASGRPDPGGPSYGYYQMATNEHTPANFLKSAEGRPWASYFSGLKPGTPAFGAMWKHVAALDPEGFGKSQYDFIKRTHYDVAVRQALRATHLNLNSRSAGVRNMVFSTAVQFGAGTDAMTRAIGATDRIARRDNPHYDNALLQQLTKVREAKRAADTRRYHAELGAALQMRAQGY